MGTFIIGLILGAIAGGIGAVIYYRRNVATIEASLVEAAKARKALEAELEDLKMKARGSA